MFEVRAKVAFWIIFGVLILASAWVRIGIPRDDLIGDKVRFPSVDAYYHLMAADYTYENWPDVQRFNDKLNWPDGDNVGQRPLNSWVIATIAKFGGATVDMVAMYLPAVLGVLVLIPVFLIGWLCWGKWAGLMGFGLLATIQGEFLGRTSLGFADHHAFEIFLSVVIILFLILALKRHWAWVFGVGVFLGLHLLNWYGAPLLVILLLAFLCVQAVMNHWRGESNRSLCIIGFVTLWVAVLIFAIFRSEAQMHMIFLIPAMFIPLILDVLSKITAKFKPYWYPIALCGLAVIGVGLLWTVFPTMSKYAFQEFMRLFGSVGSDAPVITSEVQPLFYPYGEFSLAKMWAGYGLVFIVGFIGLSFMSASLRRAKPEILLIVIWSLGMLFVTLMQRRFGYYLAVNLCLTSGYVCWLAIARFGWRNRLRRGLTMLVVFLLVGLMMLPNFMVSTVQAKNHPMAMSPAWAEAMEWMKTETPDTGDYGIFSWWDYGYWIAREGDRPVVSHPGGGSSEYVALFFLSQSRKQADVLAEKMKVRYIIIDHLMVTSKFYAIPPSARMDTIMDEYRNNTMIMRLYQSGNGNAGYRLVFESEDEYDGISQVRIFEKWDEPSKPQPQKQ